MLLPSRGQRMRMGGDAPSILSGFRIEDHSNKVDHSSPLSGAPDPPSDPPIRMSAQGPAPIH